MQVVGLESGLHYLGHHVGAQAYYLKRLLNFLPHLISWLPRHTAKAPSLFCAAEEAFSEAPATVAGQARELRAVKTTIGHKVPVLNKLSVT